MQVKFVKSRYADWLLTDLTFGNVYEVRYVDSDGDYIVTDDAGDANMLFPEEVEVIE